MYAVGDGSFIQAKFVMQRLYEAMYHEPYMQTEGRHARISNSPEYMPVVIEKTGILPGYGELVSIAHYSLQNGDLMADPEMEFTIVGGDYYPITMFATPKTDFLKMLLF